MLEAARGTFRLEEQPEVAALAPEVWDKVFRTEFLRSLGVRFGAGGFGELTVTYPALLAAERIGALGRVCYQRHRPANAAYSGSREPVRRVLTPTPSFASPTPTGPRRLPPQAAPYRNAPPLSVDPRRPPRGAPRGPLRVRPTASAGRRAGQQARALQMRFRLVKEERYDLFRALDWAVDRRRAASARAQKARTRGARILRAGRLRTLTRYYRFQLRQPIEPVWRSSPPTGTASRACNPRDLREAERTRPLDPRGLGVDEDHVGSMPAGVDYVVAETRDYYRLIAQAKYFVNNVGFPDDLVKHEGTIHVDAPACR